VFHATPLILLMSTILGPPNGPASAPTPPDHLETQLRQEPPTALANAARQLGDPRRGAILFYQPALACTGCHLPAFSGSLPPLGPDLATPAKPIPDIELIQALLDPSLKIREGYETLTIITDDGRTLAGLLLKEDPKTLQVRDPAHPQTPFTIAKNQIERQSRGGPSLMPAGLTNSLASRQQFLDLVRYLIEINEHGPARASALRPDPALIAPPLPDYERELDHNALISARGQTSLDRGRAIYDRVCANCHGTHDRPGSLPNAPRFGSATVKNGADPYSMYRTLTTGFGQMAAQTWMVPKQKYDVIHFIREAYFKPHNPSNYVSIDATYLARLPKGTTLGPEPSAIQPWVAMNFGPSLSATYEIGQNGSNFAYKGIAIRLDAGQGGISRGQAWAVYEHDTMRLAAFWTGREFIDWNGINFNGRHAVHPHIAGKLAFANPDAPGWANPTTPSSPDPRPLSREAHHYGPLPRDWAHFKGLYHLGPRTILAYTVGTAEVLDSPSLVSDPAHPDSPILTRTLEVGPSTVPLLMRVAPATVPVRLHGNPSATLVSRDDVHWLHLPPSTSTRLINLLIAPEGSTIPATVFPPPQPLEPLTHGGPKRWPETLQTQATNGPDTGPLTADTLTLPTANPWLCLMRPSGLDFLPDGHSAAVCTWDGDVWIVDGISQPERGLSWRRIASGLFQPLGLKVVNGEIIVGCRDQIVRLHDLNGDGETDYYENINSDHQVTDHFHEFAMGLQTDVQGNFYYAKAARHGLPATVPHHGTLLRVAADGSRTDILATGFRAPNGVCLNPDRSFFLTDQEGFWMPKNRINWIRPDRVRFYGNMWGYHDVTDASDAAMEPPVCWVTNAFDRSPAELVRVESPNPAWAPLQGSTLSLSYGNGKVFVLSHEVVNGQMQGGLCALPLPAFPTGIMRGRFHPTDGHLYACGLFAWAGDRTQPGGLYRIRATGKPIHVPLGLSARAGSLLITFTAALDPASASNPANFAAESPPPAYPPIAAPSSSPSPTSSPPRA
jgi:putative heme-binding domain-containing protein